MQKRKLGNSGLEIAPLMFGGNVFGWTVDEAMSFKLLDAFVGAGFDAIDTADVYSKWVPGHKGGESEIIIGKWLKARGNRSKVIIATKVGMEMPGLGQGLSKAYITARVEDSLKRLQTDYIDLYQSHADDKATPMEETLGTYEQLIKQGKVRAIGASNFDAPRLAEALKTSSAKKLPRYETLQPLYNLVERADFEKELQGLCVKENVAVMPFYALASGFLTGKYRTKADLANRTRGSRRGEVPQRPRPARPEGAGRGLGALQGQAGAGGARLAERPPLDRRADRQRHQPGAARRPDRLRAPQARRRRHQGARCGECVGLRHRRALCPAIHLSSLLQSVRMTGSSATSAGMTATPPSAARAASCRATA